MKWAFDLLEVLVLGAMKLSVIFFYRRLFRGGRGKGFEYYSKGIITIVGTWITVFFFTRYFECGIRFDYLWSHPSNRLKHCAHAMMYQNACAISDISTDMLILATPIPIVRKIC